MLVPLVQIMVGITGTKKIEYIIKDKKITIIVKLKEPTAPSVIRCEFVFA
jgi:hypothetical protein